MQKIGAAANAGRRFVGLFPLFLLLSLGLSWSIRLLAIKASSQSGTPPMEVALAATIAIAVLLTFANIVRSKFPPLEIRHLRFYALAGLFGFGAPFLLEISVAPHLPALLFVIVVTSVPIWTVFIATVFRLEPVNWRRALAVIVGFAATAMVIIGTGTPSVSDGFRAQALWILAAFGIPILYAIYVLYIAAAWPSDLDSLQGAQGQSSVALTAFAFFCLIFPDNNLDLFAIMSKGSILIIVLAEITALILLFHLARSQGGSFAAQANYVAVVAGSLIGLLFFRQQANAAEIAGIALLAFALWLSQNPGALA